MNGVNSPWNLLVSLGSIVVAIVISRFLAVRIAETLNKRNNERKHPLQTRAGGALLFAVIFVVVWCGVSFLAYLPWWLVRL